MDRAVAEPWGSGKVVRYRAESVHGAREAVVFGDNDVRADVIDRGTVELAGSVEKGKVVGPVTVTDGTSELGNIRSDGTSCRPPQVKDACERFQRVSHSMTSDEQIQIEGVPTYPGASVSNHPGAAPSGPPVRQEDVHCHSRAPCWSRKVATSRWRRCTAAASGEPRSSCRWFTSAPSATRRCTAAR